MEQVCTPKTYQDLKLSLITYCSVNMHLPRVKIIIHHLFSVNMMKMRFLKKMTRGRMRL